MADRTVLFVDDEHNILSTLRRLCRREDYTVLTADSGPQALLLLQETPAQVILSDYRMPEMTGVEFLARAKEILPDSVRIILSGFADVETVVEAVNKGEVYRFLGKPWNDIELLSVLHQSFEHHDLRRHNRELKDRLQEQNHMLQSMNERLANLVSERTTSLTLAQEVLEQVPVGLLGVSCEGEIMFTNACFRNLFSEFEHIAPGTNLDDGMPGEVAVLIRECLRSGENRRDSCSLRVRPVDVMIASLEAEHGKRGCVAVFQEQGVGIHD